MKEDEAMTKEGNKEFGNSNYNPTLKDQNYIIQNEDFLDNKNQKNTIHNNESNLHNEIFDIDRKKSKENQGVSSSKYDFFLLNNSKTSNIKKEYVYNEEETKILNNNNPEEDVDKFLPITFLEDTFNKIGYRKYQIICIIISLICITSYGINLTIYASMVIPIKKFFKLSDFELSAISSMLYIGTALGHFITGFITKTFTRRQTVIFLLSAISLLSFFIGFLKDKYSFAFFRLLIGIGIGTLLPLIINNLLEFLPLFYKGLCIMIAFFGVYIGQLIPNILMLEFIPELDENNVGLVQIISSSVSFVSLILAYFLFQDSPISLVIKEDYNNALLLIEQMDYKNTFTLEKKKMLLNEMAKKFSVKGKNKELKCLFEPKFKKSTIILSLVWFINSILFFGPAIIVSITIDKLGISLDKKTIILNQIKIILIGLSGFLIAGFVSEIRFIGRLKTIMLGFVFLSIFVLLTILIPEKFSIFYGLAYAAIPLFYFVTTIYTAEFFPSRLRDLALGFFYFINKIGGLGSQFLFLHLAQINVNFPFYAIIIMSVMNIILLAMLPFETLDKGMDFMEKLEL